MNRYYLGIDLGSTTSKAVIVNDNDMIVGRGITNTRANYKVAADIARQEAIYNARFSLLKHQMKAEMDAQPSYEIYINDIESAFKYLQFKRRMNSLRNEIRNVVKKSAAISDKQAFTSRIEEIFDRIEPLVKRDYLQGDLGNRSQFFRDIMSERISEQTVEVCKENFEMVMLAFDKSITPVENEIMEFDFKVLVTEAMEMLDEKYSGLADTSPDNVSVNFDVELNLLKGNYVKITDSFKEHLNYVAGLDIHITNMVGTGYGRALLPFPENSIISEILCHAFGAHALFPETRTVLDIGGQDTKAIQVDSRGLVTSFYMNDRCAAGCGRYLGYIADELNISLNELGTTAMNAVKEVNICSTCTVFAGAEIRELLNIGEKREDILAGLHKAIVMRAMSLLSRSGGVKNEFTFTGGVARNKAVLKYVKDLVLNSYGNGIKINIHPDSIFMGALGGAMFARRNMSISLPGNAGKKKIAS